MGAKSRERTPGEPLADPIREAYAGQRAMGVSQYTAYMTANPRAKKMKRASVDQTASRMEKEEEVQARRREIQADLLKSNDAILSKTEIAELLSDALRRAATDPDLMSSAAGLADKLNKMFGYYEPERHDMNLSCLDAAGAERKIAAILARRRKA